MFDFIQNMSSICKSMDIFKYVLKTIWFWHIWFDEFELSTRKLNEASIFYNI